MSILVADNSVEEGKALGHYVGENSEPLLCRLEEGVVYSTGLTMIMFYGDPLMKRVTEIIDRVVEAVIYTYKYSVSISMNLRKIHSRKRASVKKPDEYYSFKLYHMQSAFYLLLLFLFLSVFCFMIEVLYNCV